MPKPENGPWGKRPKIKASFRVVREYRDPSSGVLIKVLDSMSESMHKFCAKRGIRET